MARKLTVGFETSPASGEATPMFEGTQFLGSGAAATKETSVKRSGGASRSLNSGASNTTAYNRLQWVGAVGTGVYARAYFLVPSLPSSSAWIARLAPGGTNLFLVRLTTGGKVQLWNGTGSAQIGSDSTTTVAVDTWYRLEMYGKTDTGALDDFEVKLDGESLGSATAQTVTDSAVDRVDLGWMAAPGANKLIYWDDVAVNDSNGSDQNSWPGAGKIVYLEPVSDNAVTGSWTAGGGGTSNLFAAVDSDPPAGVAAASATDTSQIKNTNTSDTTGNYDANMESYSTAGLAAADSVTLVQAVCQLGSSNTTVVSGATQIVSNPAEASEQSSDFGGGIAAGTYPTGWPTRWLAPVYGPSVTVGTSPVMRVGRRFTNAAEAHCCGMRIAVEYVPGTAPESPLRQGRSPLIWRT